MIIYSKKTPYNDISVEEDYPIRKLLFSMGLAREQSAINLTNLNSHVYDYSLLAMDAFSFVNNPSNILMVGLGGGVIARQASLKFPESNIDILELDTEILDVAKKYFFFETNSKVKVYIGDAFETISELDRLYDIIILDAFDNNYIPSRLMTKDFIQLVYSKMLDNSVLGVNICNVHKTYFSHLDAIRNIFRDSLWRVDGLRNNISSFIFATKGNIVGNGLAQKINISLKK